MHGLFDRDHWREILDALSANKGRTLLTAFGVFWGVFMLMIMLGSGTGLQNGVTGEYEGLATNSFFFWTQRTSKPYRGLPAGRRFEMTNADTAAVLEHVPDAAVVSPRCQLGGYRGGNNVTRGVHAGAFEVMGDEPQIREVEAVRITSGRFLNRIDVDERRKVAVIGSRVREVLFESDEDPIGGSIRINGVYFKVVGTFRPNESGEDGDNAAQRIHVPLSSFQQAFNYGTEIGWFAITSRPGVPASAVREQVETLMKRRHRVAPDDRRAFGHWNTEKEYEEVQALFAGIRGLIWVVGLGTLAAGAIGVSNIMLVIVRERTHEIGVRRAVGASPLSVMGQIILEAFLLTGVAGYLGMVAGIGAIELTNHVLTSTAVEAGMFRRPDVSLPSAMQALALLIVSGTLAGLIPARRAVRVSLVEALRAEA